MSKKNVLVVGLAPVTQRLKSQGHLVVNAFGVKDAQMALRAPEIFRGVHAPEDPAIEGGWDKVFVPLVVTQGGFNSQPFGVVLALECARQGTPVCVVFTESDKGIDWVWECGRVAGFEVKMLDEAIAQFLADEPEAEERVVLPSLTIESP